MSPSPLKHPKAVQSLTIHSTDTDLDGRKRSGLMDDPESKVVGHLFSGRYQALVVEGSGSGYLKTVCDYVHLNPVRAKLLKARDKLSDYRWSSYGEYLKPSRDRPPWLRVERLPGDWGIPKIMRD